MEVDAGRGRNVSATQNLCFQAKNPRTSACIMCPPLLRACLFTFATIAALGCGPKTPPAFFDKPLPLLTWMGEFTRPTGTVYPQIADSSKSGSISGLAPDVGRQQWIGVIDDREHSRVAW